VSAARSKSLSQAGLVQAARQLAARDRDLDRVFKNLGPPPMWGRTPGFRTLLRIILEQQVSLASAEAIFRRLTRDVDPFTPARFADLGVDHLRSLGVTRQKAAYIVHAAEAVRSGALDLGAVARMDDAGVASALTRLKGVGPWTANIYLLMALRRPDVWPPGDIALIRAVVAVKRLRRSPTVEQVERVAEAWRPYRSVAARMMWQFYLAQRTIPRVQDHGSANPNRLYNRPRNEHSSSQGEIHVGERLQGHRARGDQHRVVGEGGYGRRQPGVQEPARPARRGDLGPRHAD
jgi:DNA-3-methyladenine glycosylase II